MELLWNEDFCSHPEILLSEHLSAVGQACKEFIHRAGVSDKKILLAAELVGKAHDFGKYTPFFQRYLRKEKVSPELRKHSPISALFSAWLIWRELKDNFLALAGFICTLRHHGNLHESFDDLLNWLEDTFGSDGGSKFALGEYEKQIESMRVNLSRISAEMEKIGVCGIKDFIDGLPSTYSQLRGLLLQLAREAEIENAWKKYFTLLLLFSALVDADQRDAMQMLEKMRDRQELRPSLVDSYRERKFKSPSSPLDPLRSKVYESTLDSFNSSPEIPETATITAPTGIGKTVLALSIALRLRERIHRRRGVTPRIIYVLPYINIIEQTYDIFSEILGKEERILPNLLLKHHHRYFFEESREDVPLDEALLLHEAWDSEVVVTTFVQFFETLVGGHKNFLRKFHNMFPSIVILDEVQTVPMEYWELVKKSIEEFVRSSNSVVVAMTATRPIIFKDWKELVPAYQDIYRNLDRVDYSYLSKEMEVKDMVDWFFSKVWRQGPNSALIVLNTIPSSIEVYRLIKGRFSPSEVVGLGETREEEKIEDAKRTVVAYLSTNIVPAERQRRIGLIKKLLEKNRKIIVISTQVVEAGVDLDFRVVVRDIGPIDSVVQVAGRCNRSGRERGKVYVVRVIEKGKKLAPRVYGNLSIWVAEQILGMYCKFSESKILEIMDEYFRKGYKAKSHADSESVLDAIKKLDFSEIRKFKFIEEEPKESVFIELNQKAREALERFRRAVEWFREAKKSKDFKKIFECKVKLRRERTELENWIVAVRKERVSQLPPRVVVEDLQSASIWHVKRNEIDEYYDMETGYKLASHAAIL